MRLLRVPQLPHRDVEKALVAAHLDETIEEALGKPLCFHERIEFDKNGVHCLDCQEEWRAL